MKKLIAVIALCLACSIANYAQLPEGYTVYDPGTSSTTSVTTDHNDEQVTTTNSNHTYTKNQSRIDKIKSKSWIYNGGGRSRNTTYVSTNTGTTTVLNTSSNTSTKVFKKDPIVVQGDGSSGVMIAGMVINTGFRIASMFLPNNGGYYGGYGYNTGYFGNNMMFPNGGYNNTMYPYNGYRVW